MLRIIRKPEKSNGFGRVRTRELGYQRPRYSDNSGRVRNRGLNAGRGKGIFCTPRHPGQTLVQLHFCPTRTQAFLHQKKVGGLNVATYPQLMPRLRKSETLLSSLHMHLRPRLLKAGSRPVEKIFSDPRCKGVPAENMYIKSDRLTVICQVTRAWSERFN